MYQTEILDIISDINFYLDYEANTDQIAIAGITSEILSPAEIDQIIENLIVELLNILETPLMLDLIDSGSFLRGEVLDFFELPN